jgi:hypothetical protein
MTPQGYVFAILALVLPAFTAHAADVTPAAIVADIGQYGAPQVVKQLNAGSGARWKAVIAGIALGQNAWLDVARAIQPGVDAGTAEDLTSAVASALKVNPAGVLRLIGTEFPLTKVCDVPLIEPTNAEVAIWKRRTLAALDRVRDPSLTTKVHDCRAALAAIK